MEIKRLDSIDVDNLKILKSIIESGNFDIKGNAVMRVAALFSWLDGLEVRFINEITLRQNKKTNNKKVGS